MVGASPAMVRLIASVHLQESVSGYASLCEDSAECLTLYVAMVGNGQGRSSTVGILPCHGDVVAFTHKTEAQTLKSLHDFTEGSIHRELGH